MSLDTVVEDIREEARERREEILESADARAEEIVAEAEAEVEREIAREREQRLSSAKLEAKQDRLEARRDVLAEVREAVESAVADIEGDEREALTRELLDDAAEEFEDGADVRVYGRESDEELLTSLLAEYDGYRYAGAHDCLGGVVVESDRSRVRVNNTFDSVLDDVWEDNLKDVSTILFDER